MANVKIPDLPLNDALTDDDLLVVEQSNGTKKVPLGSVIPDGGTAGQLLAKDSATDYDLEWIDAPHSLPSGGTTGQLLSKTSNTDYDADWINSPAISKMDLISTPTNGDIITTDGDGQGVDSGVNINSLVIKELTSFTPIYATALDTPKETDAYSELANATLLYLLIGSGSGSSFYTTTIFIDRSRDYSWSSLRVQPTSGTTYNFSLDFRYDKNTNKIQLRQGEKGVSSGYYGVVKVYYM